MRRSPFVLAGTAVGLGVVLSVHTTSGSSTAIAGAVSSANSGSTGAVSVGASGSTGSVSVGGASTSKSSTATKRTTTTTAAKASTTTARRTTSSTKRSATGTDVQYQYGDLELKVTAKGTKIVNVSVVKIDVTDPRSEQIDAYAIPQLKQETLSANSANIQGVSGASYTSQAYYQSLQSALDKLGITSSAS